MRVIACGALHDHDARRGGEAVLARVIRKRDAGVGLDAVELAPEAQRGGEADRCGRAVAQAKRRDRREHGAARGSGVCQRGGEVTADDRILAIRPHRPDLIPPARPA